MADGERLRERIRYETEVVKLMTLVTVAIGGGSASLLLNPTSTFRLGVGVVGFLMTLAFSIMLYQQHTRIQRLINQLPDGT